MRNVTNPDATLITAKDAASELGVSIDALYKRRAFFGGQKAANGAVLFNANIVRDVKEGRVQSDLPSSTGKAERVLLAGKTAANVFERIGEGKSLVDIVIELRVLPEIVHRLAREYHSMQGSLVLSGEQLHDLYQLPIMGKVPCETPAELMTLLRESLAAPDICVKCQKRPRMLCKVCRP